MHFARTVTRLPGFRIRLMETVFSVKADADHQENQLLVLHESVELLAQLFLMASFSEWVTSFLGGC